MITEQHFVPEMGLDLAPYLARQDIAGVHHLIRYLWAVECLADLAPRSVLDVACGAGYGTHAIAQRFPRARVLGIDYDEEAVRFARENYGLGNLEFRQGDVMRWCDTIGSERFHCVVTFDTIEHVPHREVMLQNLVEHLHDDGTVLLSTPCGRDENNLSPEWEAHRIEYSARSLYDFLRRYFRTVARPEEPHFPHAGVFDRLKGSGVNYWLKLNPVVCRQPVRIENPYR